MKLIDYFKNLNSKVKAYDKVAQNPFINPNISNPFSNPISITLVWVEEENKKKL